MNSIFILKLQVMRINGNLDTVEKWNVEIKTIFFKFVSNFTCASVSNTNLTVLNTFDGSIKY